MSGKLVSFEDLRKKVIETPKWFKEGTTIDRGLLIDNIINSEITSKYGMKPLIYKTLLEYISDTSLENNYYVAEVTDNYVVIESHEYQMKLIIEVAIQDIVDMGIESMDM